MNKQELRAEMVRANFTNRKLAEVLNISEQALYNKLDNRFDFKLTEIQIIIRELNLSDKKMKDIFFSNEVE